MDREEGRILDQQEERPLSIGSAVQFDHKGETIHGHLLQRQGRRRFAKVIDTEEQTWKSRRRRRERSALRPAAGAPSAASPRRLVDCNQSRRENRFWFMTFFTPPELSRSKLEQLQWGGSGQLRCL